jgi:hypothetical protein
MKRTVLVVHSWDSMIKKKSKHLINIQIFYRHLSILLKITDEKLTYGKRLFNIDCRGLVIEWIGCCCCGREY